jgi:hypothetical protein
MDANNGDDGLVANMTEDGAPHAAPEPPARASHLRTTVMAEFVITSGDGLRSQIVQLQQPIVITALGIGSFQAAYDAIVRTLERLRADLPVV